MQYSTCWIIQEYQFAGDIKWQHGQQAWGKSLLFDGIAQNKAQPHLQREGGRDGVDTVGRLQ